MTYYVGQRWFADKNAALAFCRQQKLSPTYVHHEPTKLKKDSKAG